MQSPSGSFFIGVCHDISSRVRAEEALRASEDRLQDAIESLGEGFVMFDAEDRLVLCNTRYREMYDVIGADLVPGRKFEELLRIGASRGQFPESEGRVEDWIKERVRLHQTAGGQIERQLPNGRWVKIEERRTRSGNLVGIRTDITELKRREQQLRESEERYRHLVDLLPDGVMVHVNGTVVFANDAMAEILGTGNRDRLVGRSETDFIPPEDRAAVMARRKAATLTGDVEVREARYLRADGREVPVERARAVISWDGSIAFLNLVRDITDRKRVEKEIMDARRQAETANRVKSAFLANMSHELRTPLNAIIGFSDLIARESFGPIAPGKYRDYADHIHGAGQHLLELINDILDLSKVEAGSEELMEEAIDVPGLVSAAYLLVQGRASKGNVRLERDLPDDLPALYADRRKLMQVLVNVLSNAVKFTGPGGGVTLSVRCRPDTGYCFRVTDTGIGMAAEDIPKALAPFGQIVDGSARRTEGTGLGLPLTKNLVELHGGAFGLESTHGVGTTVTMEFPPDRILTAANADGARAR
jgi:PAS domain S-box-containing protein